MYPVYRNDMTCKRVSDPAAGRWVSRLFVNLNPSRHAFRGTAQDLIREAERTQGNGARVWAEQRLIDAEVATRYAPRLYTVRRVVWVRAADAEADPNIHFDVLGHVRRIYAEQGDDPEAVDAASWLLDCGTGARSCFLMASEALVAMEMAEGAGALCGIAPQDRMKEVQDLALSLRTHLQRLTATRTAHGQGPCGAPGGPAPPSQPPDAPAPAPAPDHAPAERSSPAFPLILGDLLTVPCSRLRVPSVHISGLSQDVAGDEPWGKDLRDVQCDPGRRRLTVIGVCDTRGYEAVFDAVVQQVRRATRRARLTVSTRTMSLQRFLEDRGLPPKDEVQHDAPANPRAISRHISSVVGVDIIVTTLPGCGWGGGGGC